MEDTNSSDGFDPKFDRRREVLFADWWHTLLDGIDESGGAIMNSFLYYIKCTAMWGRR
jgi:hypothetical protein